MGHLIIHYCWEHQCLCQHHRYLSQKLTQLHCVSTFFMSASGIIAAYWVWLALKISPNPRENIYTCLHHKKTVLAFHRFSVLSKNMQERTLNPPRIKPKMILPAGSCTSRSYSYCCPHRDGTCPVSHSSAGSPAWTHARTMWTAVKEYNTGRKSCLTYLWQELWACSDNRQEMKVHFSRLSPVTSLSHSSL